MAIWETIRDYLLDHDIFEMVLRVLLAGLAGGMVGFEREYHGRAAGLRTHMMVSLGAALTAIIGVSLSVMMYETYGVVSDVQRTGAQVMSGIGFLGAGTILFKKSNSQITGLTTAAGLWATAAIGLAVGYGLYIPAFVTVIVVMMAFTLMSHVEALMNRKRQRVFIYLELNSVDAVRKMSAQLSDQFGAVEIQVTPARSGTPMHVGMEALIRIPAKVSMRNKLEKLQKLDNVVFALQIS
ncbi:MAG: MgtC/SapB family protein [Clostridia bacterium]|nr:MgtC/SapB family protein [Clostridia bacterium]